MPKVARAIFNFILVSTAYLNLSTLAQAINMAEQTKDYSSQLNVWGLIQELGDKLDGPLQTFTFRVSTTAKTNLQMFDYTSINSIIYDKTDSSKIIARGCVNTDPDNPLRGLVFSTKDVPAGYEDVSIDFSCSNYTFIPGHKYLIHLRNANFPNSGVGRMQFALSTKEDNFTGGGSRYAFDRDPCYGQLYLWGSQTANNGCNIFISPKDDLYFILSNNLPPPKIPVVFIPGIGGSEFKTSQDIIWNSPDGHGGTFAHAYPKDESVWVNQNEATKLGDDDYFDILKLKPDGTTPEASLALTGNLTPQGYGDIDTFFSSLGYVKNTNFFVFPYDWRKDIALTKNDLDALVEVAKQKSGQAKVNIVAHSMGGLVARNYILDPTKASKVNSLIELGVPHLGAPDALKSIMYGESISYKIPLIPLLNFTVIPNSEIKDIFYNLPSVFELNPNKTYFNFYDNSSSNKPYPFYDERDIDQDKTTGALNYTQTKSLLTNLKFNINLFGLAENFHTSFGTNMQTNGVKLYSIVGSGQPTLGQIREGWWINWPIELIPKYDEVYINGDGTVPLYSASLINESQNLSGGAKIYYVEQNHTDLVNKTGAGMQAVKAILNTETIPDVVKSEKIALEGKQVSIDQNTLDIYNGTTHTGLNSNGEIESNIPGVTYSIIGNSKTAFIKKSAKPVTIKITPKTPNNKTATIKIKDYSQDAITKTSALMLDTTTASASAITVDPQVISAPQGAVQDQTPPATTLTSANSTITLTPTDTSGIYQTQYSLDNGQSVQTYIQPLNITIPGDYILQYFSTDTLGNQELPQTYKFTVTSHPVEASTTSTTTSNQSSSTDTTPSQTTNSSSILSVIPNNTPTSGKTEGSTSTDYNQHTIASPNDNVLGISTTTHSDPPNIKKSWFNIQISEQTKQILINTAKIGGVVGVGLVFSFFKPPPR